MQLKLRRREVKFVAMLLLLVVMLSGCSIKKQETIKGMEEQIAEGIKIGCTLVDEKQGDFTVRNETTDQDAFLLSQAGRMTNEQKVAYLAELERAVSEGAVFDKVTGWQDIIFGVVACGGDPRNVGGVDFVAKATGYDPLDGENYQDFYVLTNLLMISGNLTQETPLTPTIMEQMMSTQNRDGAFVDDWGTTLDATILGLQALALFEMTEQSAQAVDKAVVYLSQSQDKGGYFNYSGEPSLSSTAQGVIALVGLGIDPVKDERFVARDGNLLSGLLGLYHEELAKGEQADYFNVTEGLMGLVAYDRWAGAQDYYYKIAVPQVESAEIVVPEEATEGMDPAKIPEVPPKDEASALDGAKATDQKNPEAIKDEAEPLESVAEEVSLTVTGPEGVGTILSVKVALEDGDTVYSVLRRATKAAKIPMESSGGEKKAYIEGINNVYEFDHGATSGWLYSVDNVFPNKSSGSYLLEAGQSVQWVYTLNMGQDVGAPAGSGQGQ